MGRIKEFVESWGNLEQAVRFWKQVALFEGVVIVLLGVALLRKVAEPPVVIAVPGLTQRIIYRAGEIPEEILRDFALVIAQNYMTFTPADIEHRIEEVLRFVDARAYGSIKPVLLSAVKDVKKTGYTQYFAPTSVEILGDTVKVHGVLSIKVGREKIKEESGYVVMVLVPGEVNQSNPYGLYLKHLGYVSGK